MRRCVTCGWTQNDFTNNEAVVIQKGQTNENRNENWIGLIPRSAYSLSVSLQFYLKRIGWFPMSYSSLQITEPRVEGIILCKTFAL